MTEEQQNIEARNLGNSLESLKSHPGWKAVQDILKTQYLSALEQLIAAEDVEARATIKVVDDLLQTVDNRIAIGRMAREELAGPKFQDQNTDHSTLG